MGCIVVGRSRSDVPDGVLKFATTEARLRNRPVSLVHVWDVPVEVAVAVDDEDPDLAMTALAVPGAVGTALAAQDPELLVLGRHDSSSRHLSRVVRGVLHHLECPVVVVPSELPVRVERVVVGVSRSDASVAAAQWAAHEAALRGVELVVVHAWQLGAHELRTIAWPVKAVADHQPAAEDALREWLRETLPGVEAVGVAAHGAPLDVLLDVSTASDLIAVGYTPHRGFSRLTHGHLADDLAVMSHCPVAVIPGAT